VGSQVGSDYWGWVESLWGFRKMKGVGMVTSCPPKVFSEFGKRESIIPYSWENHPSTSKKS